MVKITADYGVKNLKIIPADRVFKALLSRGGRVTQSHSDGTISIMTAGGNILHVTQE